MTILQFKLDYIFSTNVKNVYFYTWSLTTNFIICNLQLLTENIVVFFIYLKFTLKALSNKI